MTAAPETGVVIATRNRPVALRRCLEGLAEQSYRDFGVVVVDDGSDVPAEQTIDGELAAALGVRFVRQEHSSGPARARNLGVAASEAEFIVFIDDDVRPDWRLLQTLIGGLKSDSGDATHVVTFGPFVEPADWEPTPWNRWEAQQAKHEADDMLRGRYQPTWRQFHTGNNAMLRATFLAAGGFDDAFKRAEDDEFGLRLHLLGTKFVFIPDAIAWHYSERTLEAWLAIPRAYAHFDVRIDEMYPHMRYLAVKQRELGERHAALLAARVLLGRPRSHPIGVTCATLAARLLYRLGATGLAMNAFSVAYDLSYTSALTSELASRRKAGGTPPTKMARDAHLR
ncbi:MAG: glycosyltransferase family 2 protein [Hyphomicrobiales bacterium]